MQHNLYLYNMKIKYLKSHNGNNVGATENVPEGLGNYLVSCKVAEIVKDKPKREQTKDLKQDLEKK